MHTHTNARLLDLWPEERLAGLLLVEHLEVLLAETQHRVDVRLVLNCQLQGPVVCGEGASPSNPGVGCHFEMTPKPSDRINDCPTVNKKNPT